MRDTIRCEHWDFEEYKDSSCLKQVESISFQENFLMGKETTTHELRFLEWLVWAFNGHCETGRVLQGDFFSSDRHKSKNYSRAKHSTGADCLDNVMNRRKKVESFHWICSSLLTSKFYISPYLPFPFPSPAFCKRACLYVVFPLSSMFCLRNFLLKDTECTIIMSQRKGGKSESHAIFT